MCATTSVFRSTLLVSIGFLFLSFLTPVLAAKQGEKSDGLPVVEFGLPSDGLFGLGGAYLIDKKLDRKHGFIAKPKWAGVANIERLIAIGAIPVGLATSESALRANLKGIPIKLVVPYMRTAHNFLLVKKDAPYNDIMGLKGKPIAITREVTSLYNIFDFVMKKRGVDIEKEFQLKKLGAAGIRAVLEKGDVEAGWLWEAHVTNLLATSNYRSVMKLGDEINKALDTDIHLFGWVGANEKWAKEHPDLVAKLRAAWLEMIAGVQNDPEHFKKYAKKIFALEDPKAVAMGYDRIRVFLLPGDFKWPNQKYLDKQKQYLREGVELGIFPEKAKAEIDGLFVP